MIRADTTEEDRQRTINRSENYQLMPSAHPKCCGGCSAADGSVTIVEGKITAEAGPPVPAPVGPLAGGLGLKAGVNRSYYASLETGRRNASLETICRLAIVLECDAADLSEAPRP